MKRLSIVLVSVLFFVACHKKEFKQYVSFYDCSKLVETSNYNETADFVVTTGVTIEVTKKRKILTIEGFDVHIDSISPGETYTQITGIVFQTLRFVNDSVYYYKSIKDGDNLTAIGYYGVKIEK